MIESVCAKRNCTTISCSVGEHQETLNIMKDLPKKFNTSMKTFEGMEGEDAELLRTFSFICMLSYDVYLKKTIIERIVDQMLHEEKDSSKKEK